MFLVLPQYSWKGIVELLFPKTVRRKWFGMKPTPRPKSQSRFSSLSPPSLADHDPLPPPSLSWQINFGMAHNKTFAENFTHRERPKKLKTLAETWLSWRTHTAAPEENSSPQPHTIAWPIRLRPWPHCPFFSFFATPFGSNVRPWRQRKKGKGLFPLTSAHQAGTAN